MYGSSKPNRKPYELTKIYQCIDNIVDDNEIELVEKDINEAQLDFHYLTSPAEIEKKLSIIGSDNYQPIKYSNIFLNISDFTQIQNKISNLQNKDEKKIQKK